MVRGCSMEGVPVTEADLPLPLKVAEGGIAMQKLHSC